MAGECDGGGGTDTLADVGAGALIATLALQVTGRLRAGHAVVLTAYGVGSVADGFAAAGVSELLGHARALTVTLFAQAGCLVVPGTVRSPAATVTAMALFGALGMLGNVNEVTLLRERTPTALLGRVSAANRSPSVAGAPLGALLGGAAAWSLNSPPPLPAAAVLCSAAVTLIPAVTATDGPPGSRPGAESTSLDLQRGRGEGD